MLGEGGGEALYWRVIVARVPPLRQCPIISAEVAPHWPPFYLASQTWASGANVKPPGSSTLGITLSENFNYVLKLRTGEHCFPGAECASFDLRSLIHLSGLAACWQWLRLGLNRQCNRHLRSRQRSEFRPRVSKISRESSCQWTSAAGLDRTTPQRSRFIQIRRCEPFGTAADLQQRN